MIFKIVGRLNDLELGIEDEGIYRPTGLLADEDHKWKILQWINQELEEGRVVQIVRRPGMNKWTVYESRKKQIWNTAESVEEYERAIKALVKELGL